MNIKPLSDCILVKQDIEKSGLILLPESKLTSGVIVAAGEGKRNEDGKVSEMYVKVGDRIMFGEYSGQKVKHEGQEYLMMREPDVIGLLDD